MRDSCAHRIDRRKRTLATPTTNNNPISVNDAVDRINALRDIQRETGCITRRAQSYLLGSLSDDVLTEVAFRLKGAPLYADKR
jgi:hypothetical protein